jgi:hypothetical protein
MSALSIMWSFLKHKISETSCFHLVLGRKCSCCVHQKELEKFSRSGIQWSPVNWDILGPKYFDPINWLPQIRVYEATHEG